MVEIIMMKRSFIGGFVVCMSIHVAFQLVRVSNGSHRTKIHQHDQSIDFFMSTSVNTGLWPAASGKNPRPNKPQPLLCRAALPDSCQRIALGCASGETKTEKLWLGVPM